MTHSGTMEDVDAAAHAAGKSTTFRNRSTMPTPLLPTQDLPPRYILSHKLSMQTSRALVAAIAAGSFTLFLAGGLAAVRLLPLLRPDLRGVTFRLEGMAGLAILLGGGLALAFVQALLHEGVHGLAFWLYTGRAPAFALRWVYTFAGLPGWYLPRWHYIVVALAPAALLTGAGLLALAYVPTPAVLPLAFAVQLNLAGSVGDLFAALWVLSAPDALVEDRGEELRLYRPRP